MKIEKEILIKLYTTMLKIRLFEERIGRYGWGG